MRDGESVREKQAHGNGGKRGGEARGRGRDPGWGTKEHMHMRTMDRGREEAAIKAHTRAGAGEDGGERSGRPPHLPADRGRVRQLSQLFHASELRSP